MILWTVPGVAVAVLSLWTGIGLVGLLALVAACGLPRRQRRGSRLRLLAGRLLLVGMPAVIALAGRESYLRAFVDTTDGAGRMLITRRWLARHVTPQLNADGFRERPFPTFDGSSAMPVSGRIVVLGDSYAFGRGIVEPSRRLGGRLEARLQARFAGHPGPGRPEVWTLARPGWGTRAELDAWQHLGPRLRPEVVVIAHCSNDIQDHLRIRAPLRDPPRGVIGWLVDHSFAFNDLYWSLELHTNDRLIATAEAIRSAYAQTAPWQAHRRDLVALIDSIRSLGAKPVLLSIPDPWLLPAEAATAGADRTLSARGQALGKLARETGTSLVDPTPAFRRVGRDAIVLNRNDYHTNERGHDMLAAALVPEVAVRLFGGR